ncbi:long-chain-fatty-acid--CoA ligase [Sandaracinus amylolyticus]|uniref:Acetoacetyl-CoA synthetase n=1 Tax=Sandaracinus amylolyticus TaxID=927083 RepID=A0A0F6YHB2_9BACT|nr:long-chain fatty acid--CoA ligase [Sandaracinus amylolyticus]AKF05703.1 Acetoacetyl-CoA synthetase [Sandaracinus amylolyticus]
MTLNIATLLRESAKRYEAKPAMVLGDVTLPYAMLHGMVQRFAGGLAKLGVHRGQHVALMLPNVPHFTIAYYGGHYAGTPIVPLNVLLTADEIAYHLDDSDAVALVVWEGFLPQAQAAFARTDACKHLIVCKADRTDLSAPEGAVNFTALVTGSDPVTDVAATMPDDTAVILYTSGTTGRPKGAELTHFNLFFNAHFVRTQLLPITHETIALGVLPLFHSFGQTCIQNATLAAGGTVVLMPRFDPDGAMQIMQKHRVNLFAGVPTMFFALLHHPESAKYDLASLRHCISGGSAMPVEVMKAFDQKYGVNTLEGYGLSETSPVASFNTLDKPKKAGSIGVPIWGCEFRLEDDQGNVVTENDKPGEICIKGHNVMKGYWKRPEATAEAIKDGWFHSGDVATRDADGYYFIVDRKKDMIIRGGFNVYPREIEEVLYAHPAVAEAAVIGIPHASHGEEVKAVIAKKPGHEAVGAEDIIAYCKERLAAYKYPRVVEFRDALPKGPTGKILKRELRA